MASSSRRDLLIGYGCAVFVMLLWVGFTLSSRYSAGGGVGVRMTPWDIGALRFSVSGIVASGLWLAGIGRGLAPSRGVVLACLAGIGFALPAYVGFSMAPAAHGVVLLSGTLPFLAAIGTWWAFGERWGRARRLSLGLLLVGIVLLGIESYGQARAPAGAWRGDLLFLLGSSSWAAFTVMARRWGASPMQTVVSVGLGGAVLFLPVWWLVLPSRMLAAPVWEVAFQGFYQGLLAMVVSLSLYTLALARVGIARVTTITAMTPGVAGLLAVPLLGEAIGPLAVMGLLLVCVAVAVGVRQT